MKTEKTGEERKAELIDEIASRIVHGDSSPLELESIEHVKAGLSGDGWDVPTLEALNASYRTLEARLKKAKKKFRRIRKKK